LAHKHRAVVVVRNLGDTSLDEVGAS